MLDPNAPKQITIPLSEWIEDKLAFRERAVLTEERAKQVVAIDVDETLCHISYPGQFDNHYLLWRVKEWRESEKKRATDRILSEKHRKEWSVFKDNIRLTVHHLWLLSGIEKCKLVSLAYKMLRKSPKGLISQGVQLKEPFVPTTGGAVLSVEFEGVHIKL